MPAHFNLKLPPFDCLEESQKNTLLSSIDIAYFRHNQHVALKLTKTANTYILLSRA